MLNNSLVAQRARLVCTLAMTAILLGGLVATWSASAALADETDGISGSPGTADGVDDRSRFSYQAEPGQHIEDFYVARNTGTTAQVLTVFASDAYNSEDGSFGLLDTDAAPIDAGSWVSFADGAKQLGIPLEPGASQVVPFTVDVPADASPGDHAGGVAISVQSAAGEVLVDRRVATRLYVRVPGELQPGLTISNIEALYAPQFNPLGGVTTVTFTVANNGNIALGAHMVVGVKSVFGIATGELVREDLAEMLPGATRTVSVEVPGVGQFGYLNPYVRMAPTIEADALNPGALREVSRDTVIFAMPWWLLALVIAGGGLWLFLRLRARRDARNAEAWIAYTEAEAERKAREHDTVSAGIGR